MKPRLISIFLTLFSLNVFSDETQVTIYVDDAYRPFSFSDNGQPKGIYIEMLKKIFSKMKGFQIRMKPIPWNRGKMMMKSGDGFALAPVFFHGHDWPYLYPYSMPLYTETIIAVCSEKILSIPRNSWPEDYVGLSVGNVAGFDGWGGKKFRALVKNGKIDYLEVQSSSALIQMLVRGRINCIMMERQAFAYEIKRIKNIALDSQKVTLKIAEGAIIGADPVYIGYSEIALKSGKYPFASSFQKQLDAVIYQMTKSGELNSIMRNYSD